MDRKSLGTALSEAGLPPGSFRIAGADEESELPTDFWFLRPGTDDAWEVGAYERGDYDVRSTFDSEDAACRWMYRTMTGKEPNP